MQTTFSPDQLKNPRIADADRILRKCVHCGLCTAVCPTYVVLGDERDSPRGRIYLIKDMYERGRAPSVEIRTRIDRCLSCLSCTTTCPSGVDYMHLVDGARAEIEEKTNRGFKARFVRRLIAFTIPHPRRFDWAIRLARFVRPISPFLKRIGLAELATMLELAPAELAVPSKFSGPGVAISKSEKRGRVVLMTGCAQKVLRPDINDATIRLLARRGVDVIVSNGSGCCGALVHHMGRETDARRFAKRNIDAWTKEMARGNVDAVIINASGCGTTVKDYGHMLRHDPDYADRAAKIASLARDITEYLSEVSIGPPSRWSSVRVAYHAACSLQHGQRITDEPKVLLSNAGFSVVGVPEGHICCGSAGTYNILQSEIAGTLKERKIKNIKTTKPDVVAAGNIGCITQLDESVGVPVVHTVELLDWAYGGPVPRGLEHLERYATDVPKPKPVVEDFIEAQ